MTQLQGFGKNGKENPFEGLFSRPIYTRRTDKRWQTTAKRRKWLSMFISELIN